MPLSFPAKAEDVLSKRTPGLLSLLPVEVKHDELSTPVNSRPPGCPSSDPLICLCVCISCICVYLPYRWLRDAFLLPFHMFAFDCVHVCLCLIVPSLSLALFLAPSQVTGVSVSPGKDQLVVFHTKDSRDLVVCLQGMVPANESRIGELVGTLLSHFKRWVTGGRQGGQQVVVEAEFVHLVTQDNPQSVLWLVFPYHCAGGCTYSWTRFSTLWQFRM